MNSSDEKLILGLEKVIHYGVKGLAILMTFVILMAVVAVGWTIYQKLSTPPYFIFTVKDLLATFGAFMAVLIAIEIFVNITIYLREEVIHVKIVLATALMAVSRKAIILDLQKVSAAEILGLAALIFSLSIGYWLIMHLPKLNIENKNSIAPPTPTIPPLLSKEPEK